MKKILIIGLILLAIGAGVGTYLWNKPHRTAENEKPVAMLTAEEIFTQFSEGEQDATAKYLDKTVQVTGTINNITTTETGDVKITLATSDILAEIACLMKPGENISALKSGTEVAIKGICIGYDSDVQLQQSVVVIP